MIAAEVARPVVVSPDTERGGGAPGARTPPGQVLTSKWPVLQYGVAPQIERVHWELRVFGLCTRPYAIGWDALHQLPQVDVRCDIHCVTRWSRLDNVFTGVPLRTIIDLAQPDPEARFVIQHARSAPGDDWTTNIALDEFTAPDALLATAHDGQSLDRDHGGPVRAVLPRLYLWKGAKWITGIELSADDSPGFWEINGYHMHGDPWREERFAW